MKHYSFILLLLFIFVVGCGGNRQITVQGQVVFSDDGSPLTVGSVVFSNATFQASGALDSQGHFTMGSYSERDGVPAGTYNVSVIGAFVDLDSSGMNTYDLIVPKFASPSQSGIEITIDKTVRDLVIKVDRNPQRRPGS